MKIDAALVSHVAKLAALELAPEEREALAGQLTRIVEHFESLRSLPDDLLGAEEEAGETPLRDDEPVGGLPPEVVERNAPECSHGHFVVPRVVSRNE